MPWRITVAPLGHIEQSLRGTKCLASVIVRIYKNWKDTKSPKRHLKLLVMDRVMDRVVERRSDRVVERRSIDRPMAMDLVADRRLDRPMAMDLVTDRRSDRPMAMDRAADRRSDRPMAMDGMVKRSLIRCLKVPKEVARRRSPLLDQAGA